MVIFLREASNAIHTCNDDRHRAAGVHRGPGKRSNVRDTVCGSEFSGDTQENHFNLGASIGFLGAGKFGVEADFNYAPNFFSSSDNISFHAKQSNLATVMFNGIVTLPPNWKLRLYGTAGVGWMISQIDDVGGAFAVKNNDFGSTSVSGLFAQFNDHVGWRTDVRYFRAVQDNEEDLEFDVGLGSFDSGEPRLA